MDVRALWDRALSGALDEDAFESAMYQFKRVYQNTGDKDALCAYFELMCDYSVLIDPAPLPMAALKALHNQNYPRATDIFIHMFKFGNIEALQVPRFYKQVLSVFMKHFSKLKMETIFDVAHFLLLFYIEITEIEPPEKYKQLKKLIQHAHKYLIQRKADETCEGLFFDAMRIETDTEMLYTYFYYRHILSGDYPRIVHEPLPSLFFRIAESDYAGAARVLDENPACIDAYHENKITPLILAIMLNDYEMVLLLKDRGANLRLKIYQDYLEPWQYAYAHSMWIATALAPPDCTEEKVLAHRARLRRCCDATRALMMICRRQRWMDRFLVERIGLLVYGTRYDKIWE